MKNSEWIKSQPVAHRGLHDLNQRVFENTLAAVGRAIEHGYNIEVDLQPSKDGVPMVFHDYTLERLTGQPALQTRDMESHALSQLAIGGTRETIPTLADLLALVDGKVGLVLELKGMPGRDEGFVEAVANLLSDYGGQAAIMSFHHHILRDARNLPTALTKNLVLGLTAEGDEGAAPVHEAIAKECDIDFVSYGIGDLPNSFVTGFRAAGKPVISWTVRNAEDLAKSNRYCDQPTFEGFLP